MKKSIQLILVAVTAAISFISCKKEKTEETPKTENPATSANVSFRFANQVDGQPIELGAMKYTNAAGNMYQVDLLKYYVTNVVLVKDDNTEVKVGNYDLIDASDLSTCMVDAKNIPNGTYTSMKFNIGLPPDRNHNGAQDGDLDPIKGMIWDWNTGYVFFKHEGKYKDSSDNVHGLVFHYATDRAFVNITLPLSTALVVNGKDKKVFLNFNLNNLYTTPTHVDFHVDNDRQSSSADDEAWIDNLKASFSDVFSLDKIE
jgi:hypothetical protein